MESVDPLEATGEPLNSPPKDVGRVRFLFFLLLLLLLLLPVDYFCIQPRSSLTLSSFISAPPFLLTLGIVLGGARLTRPTIWTWTRMFNRCYFVFL